MTLTFTEIVDLGRELYNGMPNVGGLPVVFWPTEDFGYLRQLTGGKYAQQSKAMLLAEHIGTHIDCPSHFVEGGTSVDKVPLDRLILPGHLLDFTHKKSGEAITIVDFEAAEQKSGRRIGPGTAVCCWTGVDRNWGKPNWMMERPYIPVPTAEWLVERRITLFATDLMGMDDPKEWWWPTHKVWLSNNICMVQQLSNLDRLAGKEFLFVVLPLKMRDGTGCPVRPVALVA